MRPPIRGQSCSWLYFWISALGDYDNSFLLKPLPCVFECFFVDCFKVGEVSLMVEGLAKLEKQLIKVRQKSEDRTYKLRTVLEFLDI